MKKNNFLQGAMIATISIVVCKILGLIYVIPFYSIIGTKGGALYSYAYSIYSIFLSLSTCGIPIAVSKLVSEYNALENYTVKEKIYKMSATIMTIIGLVCFILMFIFAENIAHMFIGNIEGGNTIDEVATAIRVISVALLVVPQQSVLRGYLQGHKMITTTSISNVIEQIVRVIIIILGSYITVKVLNLPINVAVYIAIFSATIAALASYIYLKIKIRKNKQQLNIEKDDTNKVDKKELLKKILLYAMPFVIIDFTKSLYGIVDSFTVEKTLVNLGYSVEIAETAFGVVATWGTKLNMIIMSISMGMTISLVPNISESFIKKDYKEVNEKINQSFKMMLFLTIPMSLGISFLAQPTWIAFYGYNEISINIFRIFIIQVIFYGLHSTIINIAQTMNNTKLSLGALFISFILKALLNIPMMHLLKNIGIDAYYGSIVTNALVESTTFILVLLILKKKYKFEYKSTLKVLLKSIICVASMLLGLFLLSLVFKMTQISRLMSIVYIIVYTILGAIIYFSLAYKLGLIKDVIGEISIKKFIKKLKH
ncbi:MAG: polysaccharide biosynthesis protein [Clostridium sp.]|nr:polysaccharide biosynthesis protein [Clostridium sp.]MCM1443933.1 polysaccharide biosynthesis protein [Candidatus Amulumruptor caecigallinarius]